MKARSIVVQHQAMESACICNDKTCQCSTCPRCTARGSSPVCIISAGDFAPPLAFHLSDNARMTSPCVAFGMAAFASFMFCLRKSRYPCDTSIAQTPRDRRNIPWKGVLPVPAFRVLNNGLSLPRHFPQACFSGSIAAVGA